MRLPLGFLLVCFLPLRCFILVAAPKKREKEEKRRANELESTVPVIQLCVADPELRQGLYATVGTARPAPIPPCLGPGQSESEIPHFLATLMGLSGGRGPLFTVRYSKYLAPSGAIFGGTRFFPGGHPPPRAILGRPPHG